MNNTKGIGDKSLSLNILKNSSTKKSDGLFAKTRYGNFALLVFASLTLAACTSVPTELPPWGAFPAAMRQVFPDCEFIAQQGRGMTRAEAEAEGTAAIARFFSSEVVSKIKILQQYWKENGDAEARITIAVISLILTEMQLVGVRHALDAYFDRRSREWVTVAYINRAEAWQILEPRIRHQAKAFAQLFEAAENERDPFRKALRYIAVQSFSRSPEFLSVQNMGELLYPVRMDIEFATVRTKLASLPQRVDDARRNAPVFIDIPMDFESIVQNAFSRRFAALGFPVTNNRNAAAAMCYVTIEEGRQERQLGIFYYPQVRAIISSPVGTLFTFSAEAGRQAAVSPDVARRRAYQALAERITSGFSMETSY